MTHSLLAHAGCLLALVPIGASALAQTPTTLLKEGDTIVGVGGITEIRHFSILDDSGWLVHVSTTASPSDVLLFDGFTTLRVGTAIPEPANTTIASFPEVNMTDFCNHLWQVMTIAGPSITSSNDSGLYYLLHLLIQKGQPCGAPQLPAGTIYNSLQSSCTAADDECLLVASVRAPGASPTSALLRVRNNGTCDAASPLPFTEELLAREGDELPPGSGNIVTNISGLPHCFDINTRGDYVFLARTNSFWRAFLDGTSVLAEPGAAVPGGSGTFVVEPQLTRVDLNDFGDYVLATQTSVGEVLIKNGTKLYQTGDAVPDPSVSSFQLTNFGSATGFNPLRFAPVFITNSGDVVWFGAWNDPDTTRNEGIFVNDRLVVRKGVTVDTAGHLVRAFVEQADSFRNEIEVSWNGRYLLFEAVVAQDSPQPDKNALLILDFGESVPFGTDKEDRAGCAFSYPYAALSLRRGGGGFPLIGNASFTLQVDNIPQPEVVKISLMFCSSRLANPCGVLMPPPLLINTSTLLYSIDIGVPPAMTSRTIPVPIPNDSTLVGLPAYVQALFKKTGDAVKSRSNGLRVVLGDPTF